MLRCLFDGVTPFGDLEFYADELIIFVQCKDIDASGQERHLRPYPLEMEGFQESYAACHHLFFEHFPILFRSFKKESPASNYPGPETFLMNSSHAEIVGLAVLLLRGFCNLALCGGCSGPALRQPLVDDVDCIQAVLSLQCGIGEGLSSPFEDDIDGGQTLVVDVGGVPDGTIGLLSRRLVGVLVGLAPDLRLLRLLGKSALEEDAFVVKLL